jgi:gliding motility-associated-like protein
MPTNLKSLFVTCYLLLVSCFCFATHNRAGFISYTCVKDPKTHNYTNTYHFKIYTYTNPTSVGADRCYETLIFTNLGINPMPDTLTLPRTNYTPSGNLQSLNLANCGAEDGSIPGDGLMLVYPYVASCGNINYGGVKVNTYEGDYTFSSNAAQYIFGMVDPNLDANVNNINSSSNVAFALLDTITLTNFGANYNNTPLVTNPPIDNACAGHSFFYNPGMTDPDGDSLAFSIIPYLTGTQNTGPFYPVSGYSLPSGGLSVNALGELSWLNVPSTFGEYNIDLFIREYRKIGGERIEIASEVFAVQIYVQCCSTTVIMGTTSVRGCIEAGQTYNSPIITATESSTTSTILSMTATGVPLTPPNTGTFPITGTSSSVSGSLHWTTDCNDIQLIPYFVTVRAFDNSTPVDANYSSISVQVVSPPVSNLVATPTGDSVKIIWSPPSCGTNTANVIVGYIIYRANDCVSYTVSPCATGVPPVPANVPPSTWYQPIGNSTSPVYYDPGLPAGNSYSYIVIAQYADGSLSMAATYTSSSCVTLHLGIPILTNVSVDTTDISVGSMFVRWHKPLTFSPNLDTSSLQGPYHFVLQRNQVSPPGSTPVAANYTTVYTSPNKTYFAQLNTLADTTYMDNSINTYGEQFYYKVLFYDSNGYIGSGSPASSIFASGVGHDKRVALSWTSNTPWTNTKYYIYRQNFGSNPGYSSNLGYTLVDSTTLTVDTVKKLTNKYNYCFRIKSVGTYFNTAINDSANLLINWSQKVCVTPIDDSPPCQPQLTVAGNCNESINKLTWRNPDNACNINDVLKYYIYYTPKQDSTLIKIDSVLNVNDTTYTTDFNSSNIAGCYIIVAVDSAGNQSPLANETCTDDCPEYELPNIFTPNSDNVNDLYIPVKNRYVRSVDFVMYNRWGEVVYQNTNPSLGWDGKSKQMNRPVPDGTYFYTCTVNEIHYYGIQEIKLKGFVQLIR